MRKCDFWVNHRSFDEWIVWYGDMIKRILQARRVIRTSFEKRELIEAIVLRCCARWELLVTRDIITSLNRDCSFLAGALGLKLRRHLSRDECEAIVSGTRYLDFRSVAEVQAFGKRYLNPHLDPFAAVTRSGARRLDEFFLFRNLLAHYSSAGWRSYRKLMKDRFTRVKVVEPGTFLSEITPEGHYRWADYLLSFLKTSGAMMRRVSGASASQPKGSKTRA
jgi:hypothetical protein